MNIIIGIIDYHIPGNRSVDTRIHGYSTIKHPGVKAHVII